MKRLFSKSGAKPPAKSLSTSTSVPVTAKTTAPHTTGLQPKDIVPPVPHPYPYDSIALLVSEDGLLLRPNLSEPDAALGCVRVAWGKGGQIEELSGGSGKVYDWKEAIIVHGIIGILELFSGQ